MTADFDALHKLSTQACKYFGFWHKTVAASVETVVLNEKQEVLMLCPCPVTINQ